MMQWTRERELRPGRETSAVPESCRVSTPRPLADAMVAALGDSAGLRWLEPSVGDGVFLQSLAAAGVGPSRIRGLDLDPMCGAHDTLGRVLRGREFLYWSARTRERFNRVVANPPYAALTRMPSSMRDAAARVLVPGSSSRVSNRANSWFAFLCAGIGLLKPNGSLAFLLPASWEYSNYASPLRKGISEFFDRVEVHRSQELLFPGVLEGNTVLLAFGYRPTRPETALGRSLALVEHEGLTEILDGLRNRAQRTVASQEPSAASSGETPPHPEDRPRVPLIGKKIWTRLETGVLRLGDVFEIRIGAVTGDARFFVLSEAQRIQHQLPRSALRPVISRSHHLRSSEIGIEEWSRLRDSRERVWLFSPTIALAKLRSVRSYLESH